MSLCITQHKHFPIIYLIINTSVTNTLVNVNLMTTSKMSPTWKSYCGISYKVNTAPTHNVSLTYCTWQPKNSCQKRLTWPVVYTISKDLFFGCLRSLKKVWDKTNSLKKSPSFKEFGRKKTMCNCALTAPVSKKEYSRVWLENTRDCVKLLQILIFDH